MSKTSNPQSNGTLAGAAESEQSTRPGTEMLELARPRMSAAARRDEHRHGSLSASPDGTTR